MKRTTKARLIALSVFGLALASLPASIIINAPEAKAVQVVEPVASAAPSVASPEVEEAYGIRVWEPTKKAKKSPRKARKTCKRIALTGPRPAAPVANARPTGGSVVYCDHL